MATRMRLMARSVSCKPCAGGPEGFASAGAGPAKAACDGLLSMVTMFDIVACLFIPNFQSLRWRGLNRAPSPERGSLLVRCCRGLNRFRRAVLLLPVANGRANRIRSEERRVGKEC